MAVQFPPGFQLQRLSKQHPRKAFSCGVPSVDQWIRQAARQAQDKKQSVTCVLVDPTGAIASFYTLASGQLSFDQLPDDARRGLTNALQPIITLAWMGVDKAFQGRGLGERTLAAALAHCYESGATIPFIGIVLDCVDDSVKAFYQHYDFIDIPGYPLKLFLSWKCLCAMMAKP